MKSQFRHYYKVLSFARKMRKNPTKAEQAFWNGCVDQTATYTLQKSFSRFVADRHTKYI